MVRGGMLCATSRKVVDSIPNGVTGIFHLLWPSGRFGLCQILVPGTGGKGNRCVGLQPHHLHVPIVLKSGSLNILEPSGPIQACTGISFSFYLTVGDR
jgi:hypothetical protein